MDAPSALPQVGPEAKAAFARVASGLTDLELEEAVRRFELSPHGLALQSAVREEVANAIRDAWRVNAAPSREDLGRLELRLARLDALGKEGQVSRPALLPLRRIARHVRAELKRRER